MEKNHVSMEIDDCEITVRITARSNEVAVKIYRLLEKVLMVTARADLEQQWRSNDPGN